MLSKRQQTVEQMHQSIAQTFDMHLGRMPVVDSVRRFLDATLHFANITHRYYIERSINKKANVTSDDLLIAAREESHAEQRQSKKSLTLLLT